MADETKIEEAMHDEKHIASHDGLMFSVYLIVFIFVGAIAWHYLSLIAIAFTIIAVISGREMLKYNKKLAEKGL